MRISTTSNYLFYCICTKHDLPWIVTPKLNEGDQIKIYFKHSFNKNPLYLKKYTEIIEQSVEYTTSDASENYTLEECATGCNQLFTVNACGKYVIYLPFTNCEVNSVLIISIQIIKGK